MLLQLILFFFLLIILFAVSKKISSRIYSFFFLLTNSQKISVTILSLFLLPGTIVHELSHFLLASLLRVPTGELSVIPVIDEQSGEMKAGKLEIGQVDPFRHTLVGLAPTIIGLIIIYLIGKLFLPQQLTINNYLLTVLALYLFFVVTNTMFASKKDTESVIIALPVTLLIVLTLYLIGIRISLAEPMFRRVEDLFIQLNGYLLICTVINFLVFIFLVLNLTLWQKILKKRIKKLD